MVFLRGGGGVDTPMHTMKIGMMLLANEVMSHTPIKKSNTYTKKLKILMMQGNTETEHIK